MINPAAKSAVASAVAAKTALKFIAHSKKKGEPAVASATNEFPLFNSIIVSIGDGISISRR
jgi:dsDNA-specific endonuclease/ATPase MutS2